MNQWDLYCFFQHLAIGSTVTLQYDTQAPSTGIYEGFQAGSVLLRSFDGFPGLTRINIRRINAVSV